MSRPLSPSLSFVVAVLLTGAVHAQQAPPATTFEWAEPKAQPSYKPSTPTGKTPALPTGPRIAPRGGGSGSGISEHSDDAESGVGQVIDQTNASYDLIQTELSAEGAAAFHLANPFFEDNGFELVPTLTPTGATKLHFESRLGWARAGQVARVQLSTDNGSTWPQELYTQPGSDGPGERSFQLVTIDLGSWAGQDVKLRFFYQRVTGSAYTQTASDVGWLVDNIQIGEAFIKRPYSVGEPTDLEQHYLELINRSRADALAEAQRLANITDPDVVGVYSSRNIDTADIIAQYEWGVANCFPQSCQPLSFHPKLLQMARLHSLDMFVNIFQGHTSSSGAPAPFQPGDTLGDRRDAIGYTGSGGMGENVYANSKSVEYGHAAFEVDWGNINISSQPCYNVDFRNQGMQNPPGHRNGLHRATFKEIGIGIVTGTNGSVGPQLVTQDLADAGDVTLLTGVVYDDINSNNFYDPGEGVEEVRVDVEGSVYFALTTESGAWSIPVDGDGAWSVTFSGSVPEWTTSATVTDGLNEKIDYVVSAPPIEEGFTTWAADNGILGGETGDHDKDGVANLIEYALANLDATTPDSGNAPELVGYGDLTFTIAKNPAAAQVAYVVETSDFLDTWSTANTTVITDTADALVVEISGGAPTRFVRLRIVSTE